MLSASARRITTVPSFLKLWVHENRRVFKDRLINDEDRSWLDNLLAQTLHSHFAVDFSAIIPAGPLIFGDFMSARTQHCMRVRFVVFTRSDADSLWLSDSL